jgi:hypothetical protein
LRLSVSGPSGTDFLSDSDYLYNTNLGQKLYSVKLLPYGKRLEVEERVAAAIERWGRQLG